ncbi:MAG: AAA family ATPase, partial [Alphaproteobacteria bacterium]|nr:AAA family ATPase [Alphaproteobacteria bacterium]
MRLRRLDLIRYGKFTDHHLDFGEAAKGQPDLHIVYGPNEAGKSTALAGFLDFLYGIEPRSRFDFFHSYKNMRVGAVLDLANGPQELIRIKRPQNSLLNAREQPVQEGLFVGELGGIDRGSYRTMFSLDDETLEAGGESILASQGELGELLFSASTGLAQLSLQLEGLRTESEEFYKYRGRDNLLAELKERLAKLQNERENLDTQAPHYAKLVENRNRTQSHYDAVIAERGRIYAHIEEIQKLLNALPLLSELRGLREMIKPLASLPEPPPGWTEEFPSLQKAEIELAVHEQRLAEEIETFTAAFEAIVVDELILEQAEKLTALDGLRARYLTADDDLENRRIALRESELVIAGILDRIDCKGEAEPGRLILRASVLGPLRSLIEARSGIDADLKSAQDELAEAHQRLDEAQRKFSEQIKGREGLKDRKAQMAALEACVAELRMSDHAARRRILAAELEDRHMAVQDRLKALHPWQGHPQELADLSVPNPSVIETWKSALSTAEKEVSHRKAAVEPLISDHLHLEAELAAIELTMGVVSDQEADRIRSARDKAWADHRRTLDQNSADQFEAALHEDDLVTEARLTHMSEIAKRNQASQRLLLVEA